MAIENWETTEPDELAQQLEPITEPTLYKQWETTAQAITQKWWETENPTECLPPVPQQTPDNITADGKLTKVKGITVAAQLGPNLTKLLAAAEQDGIILKGWGWRDGNKQIELRKKHCGPTEFDIYKKKSSKCKPPTARPGKSMHETGLAVDFTCNGAPINTRRSKCFKWLQTNAQKYGLKNLPSEPWHWSTTGR